MSSIYYVGAGTVGLSTFAYWLYHYTKKQPTFQYCHGTTFGSLYLMSRLQGVMKNSLVPYGDLEKQKIPTFSGECFRGISDNGINRTNTSWSNIHEYGDAVRYSYNFPFSPQKSRDRLMEVLGYYQEYIRGDCSSPPLAKNLYSGAWNKLLLQIRQVRAWDEDDFQRNLKGNLIHWIEAEDSHFNHRGYESAEPHEILPHIERLKNIKQELVGPPTFQLTLADKSQISKTYPIVFLSTSLEVSSPPSSAMKEYGCSRPLKLGREIQGIATEPKYIDEVKAHLEIQGIGSRVTVIAMDRLPLERLNSCARY